METPETPRPAHIERWLARTGISFEEMTQECQAHGCTAAFAFGSTVRGDTTETSDVDIAVVGGKTTKPIHVHSAFPVEIHSWPNLPLRLRLAIVTEGVCLYEETPSLVARLRWQVLRAWSREARERAAIRAEELAHAAPLK